MLKYAIKRILLMIPTFFSISFLIFVLLNFAPGNPGSQMLSAEGSQNAQKSGDQRESYRIFKEQFNLDKPVLFNTRYNLAREDIESTLLSILNLDKDIPPQDRIDAQDRIEDWGGYAVPGLMDTLMNAERVEVRALASERLAINAKKRLIGQYSKSITPEDKARNKQIAKENNRIKEWFFVAQESSRSKKSEAEVKAFWTEWWEGNQSEWNYTSSDKMSVLFLDTRFAKYWYNLLRLDFGISHLDKQPVLQTVFSKLKYSITLAVSSVFLVYLMSLPLGIWSAVKQNTLPDRIITTILFMLYSLPSYFTAVILLKLFSVEWPLFPNIGFESMGAEQMTTLEYIGDVAWHVTLPIICMSYGALAALSRYARTGLLDVIRADYIRTARAKGLPEGVVIIKHAARNGMIPILTLMASLLPALIGGSVIIEVIFGIPGMGSYIFESITLRDYNAVMAVLLISSTLTLIGMLLSDLSYALVDPRITFD
ncbi:MAG: ABC transporter permease [Myxococcota bacterium]|nr:ABC transporter permease [Myxococcota bacterium]